MLGETGNTGRDTRRHWDMLGDIGKDTVPSLRDWDALGAIMGGTETNW